MPFTPAHVAAVLPVVGRRRPSWVVPCALVIGSMVPDVLYFVPIGDYRDVSHSVHGLLTLDLLLGLVLVGLWRAAAGPVLRDLAPRSYRERVPPPLRPTAREWLWSVPCLLLGGATHLVWDAFTHANGWAVMRWPAVFDRVVTLGLPVYSVAQYGSSVVGLVLVLVWAGRALEETTPRYPGGRRATPGERRTAWVALLALPLVAGSVFASDAALAGEPVTMVVYVAVVRALSSLGLVAALTTVWWHQVVSRRPVLDGASAGRRM
ncbi:DUF4184 family protein [Phycicoccus sp. Soil748]|uniref:DUF4184 family protein n=1 Tax=Intrasporangiaceae TaxID=85021 RepID=UPI0007039F0D|nr:DUF4184 family protein [Phycicoccus sp. Soil748]KRE52821.1 hypothetical protein ASG70_15905 [Phycicoccus sp. Soil748]